MISKTYTLTLLLIICAGHVLAATNYTEWFTYTNGGWVQSTEVGKNGGTLRYVSTFGNPTGCLRAAFSIGPGTPGGAFVATGSLSSVSFMGDYASAQTLMIGFDFRAENLLPADLELKISSSSGSISRYIGSSISATGVWHSFRYSLASKSLGGWFDPLNKFDQVITNVSKVELIITRKDLATGELYYIDNILLDALPTGGGVTAASNTPQIVWNNLRTNEVYRVEASPDLVVPQWDVIATITAQTSTVTIDYPATNDYRFFRMVMP